MAHSNTWNAANEASPADSDPVSEGAGKIRTTKLDLRERINIDHYMDPAGTDADHGEHRKVTFQAPISTPANVANKGFVYGKDANSKIELHFEDEDGNELQLSTAGDIGAAAMDMLCNNLDVATAITVDTIDEKTPDNGVVIDGLNVTDAVITTANVVDSDQYIDDSIDFAHLTPGLFQIVGGGEVFVNDSGWQELWHGMFICPADPTSLKCTVWTKKVGGNGNIRFRVNSVASTDVSVDNTSYAQKTTGAVSISGLTPGTVYEIDIQGNPSGGDDVYLNGFTIYKDA